MNTENDRNPGNENLVRLIDGTHVPASQAEYGANPFKAGDGFDIDANQATRDGEILAVRGDRILLSYKMPAGRVFVGEMVWHDSAGTYAASYRTHSAKALPAYWQKAIAEQGGRLSADTFLDWLGYSVKEDRFGRVDAYQALRREQMRARVPAWVLANQ